MDSRHVVNSCIENVEFLLAHSQHPPRGLSKEEIVYRVAPLFESIVRFSPDRDVRNLGTAAHILLCLGKEDLACAKLNDAALINLSRCPEFETFVQEM